MAVRKKAVVFTFISIMIVSLLLMISSTQSYVTLKNKIPSVKTRVSIADNYVRSLDDFYIVNSLKVSSYRALVSMVKYIQANGTFFTVANINTSFREIVLNGSLNGLPIKNYNNADLMTNETFFDKLTLISNKSEDILDISTTFLLDYKATSVRIFQDERTGPWTVGVTANVTYTVDAGLARWSRTENITAYVDIMGIDEPFLSLATGLRFNRTIRKTNYTFWDTGAIAFNQTIGQGSYIFNTMAPSFLTRLKNRTTSSACCGIETPLNPNLMGLPNTPKSYIDYCYYSLSCPGSLGNVSGISTKNAQKYTYFALDDAHAANYSLTLIGLIP